MLTLTEAADQLGLAASTLRHQVQAGRLRARLIGKTYVVTRHEVERYRREQLGKPGRPSHGPHPDLPAEAPERRSVRH